ncbi:hypothetical protein U1Q18_025646 [Sarracenia purpurea var. burkii]
MAQDQDKEIDTEASEGRGGDNLDSESDSATSKEWIKVSRRRYANKVKRQVNSEVRVKTKVGNQIPRQGSIQTIPYGPAIQPAALPAARPTVQQRGFHYLFTAALHWPLYAVSLAKQ